MFIRRLSFVAMLSLLVLVVTLLAPAQTKPTPRKQTTTAVSVTVLNAQLKILETKRVKTWAAAGRGGFSVSEAPEGREFILLKYALEAASADDLPSPHYAKLEATNGEMYFETQTATGKRSETEIEIEQIFSVPLRTTPKALHFAKLVQDPAGGNRPLWTSAAHVDLSRSKFLASGN